jgi:NAD(P)-dependent dehydrogenase (short-subunit alcohol dehydrogenase family)
MQELGGKVLVIVGGARGVGRATALFAAAEGAKVALVDPGADTSGRGEQPAAVAEAVAAVEAAGGSALGFARDVRRGETLREVCDEVRGRWGRIDGAFFSAGLSFERALIRTSDAELDEVLALHVAATHRFVRELGRVLVEQRSGGSLLLSAGAEGLFGAAQRSALAAASGAVIGLCRSAALELRRQEIRINTLVPTARTRLTEGWPLFSSIRSDSLTPEHAARVAAFLLSDAADGVTGETVGVAGGRVYALRATESPGVFFDGPPAALEDLAKRFPEALRTSS